MYLYVRDFEKKCEINENSENKSLLMKMYFVCHKLSYNMENYDGGGGPVSTEQLTSISVYIRQTAKCKLYEKKRRF